MTCSYWKFQYQNALATFQLSWQNPLNKKPQNNAINVQLKVPGTWPMTIMVRKETVGRQAWHCSRRWEYTSYPKEQVYIRRHTHINKGTHTCAYTETQRKKERKWESYRERDPTENEFCQTPLTVTNLIQKGLTSEAFPNSFTNWELYSQTYEPLRTILNETTTMTFEQKFDYSFNSDISCLKCKIS